MNINLADPMTAMVTALVLLVFSGMSLEAGKDRGCETWWARSWLILWLGLILWFLVSIGRMFMEPR